MDPFALGWALRIVQLGVFVAAVHHALKIAVHAVRWGFP